MSKRVFGEAVTSLDVERLAPDTGPTLFVRICEALIAKAVMEHLGPGLVPNVSDPINVPDGGVDAEVTLPVGIVPETGGLIGPGRTTFQFKYRDASRADASAIRSKLVRRITDEFPRVAPKSDRYVLMLNVRLSPSQRRKIEETVVRSSPEFAGRPVVVWGAAELATTLNANPSVRHMFFADGALSTLELAHEDLKAAYAPIGWPTFAGRDRETHAIQEFLTRSNAPLLQIAGPRYSGKTRLVIEALRAHRQFTVWADGPEALSLAHFRDLDAPGESAVLVVDRNESQEGEQILDWARSRRWLKTIAITAGDGWGDDRDIVGYPIVRVGDLTPEVTRSLVSELDPGMSFARQSWVYEASEGLPGVALHLAAALRHAREAGSVTPPPLERGLSDLPRHLESQLLRGVTASERRALEVTSLMPLVGVQGPRQQEIETLCQALGVRADEVTAALPSLERRGLIRRRGRFVETIPPILADYLAGSALSNPSVDLAAMALKLPPPQFRRFLERVRQTRGADATASIEGLLRAPEWFGSLMAVADNTEVFEVLAPALPRVALEVLASAMASATVEDLRRVLEGDRRRPIIRALERASLRSDVFPTATKLLLGFAEAENEAWDNNATALFTSRFHWRHPEITAPYSVRLSVLRETALTDSVARRRLVAEACGAAFQERQTFRLTTAAEPDVPEESLRATWGEAAAYAQGIVEILGRLNLDESPEVATAAKQSVLRACEWFLRLSVSMTGHRDLGEKTLLLLRRFSRTAVSAEERATIAESLERLERSVTLRALAKSADISDQTTSVLALLRNLRGELGTTETLRDRLWKWLGPGSWRPRRVKDEADAALNSIAHEIVESPGTFRTHVAWLIGPEAKGAVALFGRVGALDRGGPAYQILCADAEGPWWSAAFAQYLYGWRSEDSAASDALDQLIVTNRQTGARLVDAVSALAVFDGAERTVARVRGLVSSPTPDRSSIATRLAWSLRWNELSDAEAWDLFWVLDDGTPAVRRSLLGALAARHDAVGSLSPALRNAAWSLLEETFPGTVGVLKHEWDSLAASLGEVEPDRLLALLNVVLRAPELDTSSLDHELPQLWEILVARHRKELFEALVGRAMSASPPHWIDATLEALMDPQRDHSLIMEVVGRLGVDAARTVSLGLDAEREGFWRVARDLVAEFGDDPLVAERLSAAVLSGMWTGNAVALIDERKRGVAQLTHDQSESVRIWARRLEAHLNEWRTRAEHEQDEDWIWDARLRRIETEELVHSDDEAKRLWAIGRILKDAPERRVRELLTPSEILEALPRLPQLDHMTRTKWERWARYHAAHSS